MSDELLPCPFCGHHACEPVQVQGERWGSYDWVIHCSSSHCGISARIVADDWSEQIDGALNPHIPADQLYTDRLVQVRGMWNRRPQLAQPEAAEHIWDGNGICRNCKADAYGHEMLYLKCLAAPVAAQRAEGALDVKVLDSRRLDWLDQHCAFVADAEYKIGPFAVGELRQMADAGLAADWVNARLRPAPASGLASANMELAVELDRFLASAPHGGAYLLEKDQWERIISALRGQP